MKKMSVLEMTQNILSAMNSDEVNSISDTVESQQVAEEIRNTFNELYSNREISNVESLITLESGSSERPNTLRIPSNVTQLKWIKYRNNRNRGHWKEIDYLDPEEFIHRIIEEDFSPGYPTVSVPLLSTSPQTYLIRANQAPDHYTVLDDSQTLVFNSFDQEYESFLTGSSAVAWGVLNKSFILEDDFIPDIPINLFPHLLAEAKSACFINVKEMASQKEEQRARRQLVRSQKYITKTQKEKGSIYAPHDYSRKR